MDGGGGGTPLGLWLWGSAAIGGLLMPSSLRGFDEVDEDPLVIGVVGIGGGRGVVAGDSMTSSGLTGEREFLLTMEAMGSKGAGGLVGEGGRGLPGKKGWKGVELGGVMLGRSPPWAFRTLGRLWRRPGCFIQGFCPLVIAEREI